jgi:four helix bundle protein
MHDEGAQSVTLTRIEQLAAWRAARALAVDVHHATGEAAFDRDTGLRADLRAAATSIMTSLAEGCEQKTCAEFDRYLRIAIGSAAELLSLTYLAEDTGLLPVEAARATRLQVMDVSRHVERLRRAIVRYRALPLPADRPRVN